MGIYLHGGPCWAAWKGACLPGTYVLKKALEMGISLHKGPNENVGGGGEICLPGTLKDS